MGKIVGAVAMSHIMFQPDGIEKQANRILDSMLDIRRIVAELEPDLLILAGGDHLNNFNLAMQVPLAIGVCDEFQTLGDGGVPQSTFAGNRQFAEGFARFANRHDFELVQAEEITPDHGMAFPKLVIDPANRIPAIPLYINAAMPVPPSASRCHRLGQLLHDYVSQHRPADERVVVVGAGGLSHWLRMPGEGRVAEDFDRHVIEALTSGRADEIAAMTSEELIAKCGNGGLEVIAWLFACGAVRDVPGECVFYEAVPEWITGMGAVAWTQVQ
jgi:hypothetical protein